MPDNLKNISIVTRLLKSNGINHVVISPGGTNIALIKAIQDDPFLFVILLLMNGARLILLLVFIFRLVRRLLYAAPVLRQPETIFQGLLKRIISMFLCSLFVCRNILVLRTKSICRRQIRVRYLRIV